MGVLDNRTYLDAVAWAEQVLGRAGFPYMPYHEKCWSLLDLVGKKGFREGEDLEWYAAGIRWYRTFIESYYSAGCCFLDDPSPHRIGRRGGITCNG